MRTSRACRIFWLIPFLLAASCPPGLEAAIRSVTDCGDTGLPAQLRQAVNTASAGDTILVPACTIVLNAGALVVAQSVTVSGAGASDTLLSAGHQPGVSVLIVRTGIIVTLSGLSIQDGNAGTGGGIANLGTLIVTDSVIQANAATTSGGIDNQAGASLTLLNSTVAGNSAVANGGGIGNQGFLTIVNSTVSGNRAGALGGGVRNEGALSIVNSTIAVNTAATGGGLYNGAGNVALKNTIVANNTALLGADCRAVTSLSSAGHNLESGTTCGFTQAGDLGSRNPLLGPLQGNGGTTPTHALLAGSPAIDAGDAVGCPATDQRGVIRPQHGKCDIGAFEAEAAFASGSFSISPPSGNYVSTQTFDVVLLVNALGRTIVDTRATLDGADATAALARCLIAGTLLTGGVTARCPGVQGVFFVPGTHTISVTLQLSDGSILTDAVIWEVDANTEP